MLQYHGSKTVPDRVIFQDPRKEEKEKLEKLGLEWNAKRMGLVLSIMKIGQQTKLRQCTLVKLTLVLSTTSRVPLLGSETFRLLIMGRKTLGGTGISCQK